MADTFQILDQYWLVMPILGREIKTGGGRSWVVAPPNKDGKSMIHMAPDKKSAMVIGKALVVHYPNEQIILCQISHVMESTGKCPFVVKAFTKDGDLIPEEIFDGG